MEAVAHLMAATIEADVVEMTTAQVAVDPVSEDSLIGTAKLPGSGEHAATVYEDGKFEGLAVVERESFAGQLSRTVERHGRSGRERLGDTGDSQAGDGRKTKGAGRRAKSVVVDFDGKSGQERDTIAPPIFLDTG